MKKQYSYTLFLLSERRLYFKNELKELRKIDGSNQDLFKRKIEELDEVIKMITNRIKNEN